MAATLILDIGAGLNLLASGRAAAIAAEVGVRFALETTCSAGCDILQEEDGTLMSGGLQTVVDAGAIDIVELDEPEIGLYIELAGRVGDQEAATLAVAARRRWGVLSDDPVLTSAAAEMEPPVPIRTTAALLHAWARTAEEADVVEALRRIETHAAFIPPAADPWCAWWQQRMSPSAA